MRAGSRGMFINVVRILLRMDYVLKLKPEDFVVEELHDGFGMEGRYLLVRCTKRDRTTLDAARTLARFYNVPENKIGYAGMKDKKAVTSQVFSVPTSRNDIPKSVPEFIWQPAGRRDEPISLGQHSGNKFTITVRNIEKQLKEAKSYPNYFDEQRFGESNVSAGIALLKGDFKKAVEEMQKVPRDKHFLSSVLNNQPNNYIAALQLLPKKRLRLYIHSVQSSLWNELLVEYVKGEDQESNVLESVAGKLAFPTKEIQNCKIPIVGFGSESSPLDKQIDEWLSKHKLSRRSFILKQFPGASSEGTMRTALIELKDLEISRSHDDDFHPGKKKQTLSFILSSGSYATIVIKAMTI
jgi:tRNA pseudouridine13 synthase